MMTRQPSEELWAESAFHNILFWNWPRGDFIIIIILIIFMIIVIISISIVIQLCKVDSPLVIMRGGGRSLAYHHPENLLPGLNNQVQMSSSFWFDWDYLHLGDDHQLLPDRHVASGVSEVLARALARIRRDCISRRAPARHERCRTGWSSSSPPIHIGSWNAASC